MKISCAFLLLLIAFAGCVTASAQVVKIGTVEMKRVFEWYYRTDEFAAQVTEARREAAKELEDRMATAKELLEEVKKLDKDLTRPALSPELREEKQKLRKQKADALQLQPRERHPTREKQVKELEERVRAEITEEVKLIVADQAKAEAYDLVFDKSGASSNGVPIVLNARDSFDLTVAVIDALKRNHGQIRKTAERADAPRTSPSSAEPSIGAQPER